MFTNNLHKWGRSASWGQCYQNHNLVHCLIYPLTHSENTRSTINNVTRSYYASINKVTRSLYHAVCFSWLVHWGHYLNMTCQWSRQLAILEIITRGSSQLFFKSVFKYSILYHKILRLHGRSRGGVRGLVAETSKFWRRKMQGGSCPSPNSFWNTIKYHYFYLRLLN